MAGLSFLQDATIQPWFADKERESPIAARFLKAILVRMDLLVSPLAIDAEWLRIAGEISELCSYFFASPAHRPTGSALMEELDKLTRYGWNAELKAAYLAVAQQGRRGRPETDRDLVLSVLEMKERKPQMSWRKIAIDHCRCGAASHGKACADRIRIRTITLQKRMRALGA